MKLTQYTLTLILILSLFTTKAQMIMSFASGRTVNESEFANITGTPYMLESWMPGIITFANDKVIQVPIKYNEKDDEVYFKSTNGETMTFADPVKYFIIKDGNKTHLFRNGYGDGSGLTEKSYLEVIADGKTQFLKKLSKSVVESKDYTSSITNKRFLDVTKYYILTGGKMHLVKKDTKSVLAVLTDKQADIQKYIKDNNFDLKTDADIIKVFSYYNTL